MVKSTYVLDIETAKTLDRLAREWQVSKSEALRRLINSAGAPTPTDRISQFKQVQKLANVSRGDVDKWMHEVRAERQRLGRTRDGKRR
jgi:hypothetical protein